MGKKTASKELAELVNSVQVAAETAEPVTETKPQPKPKPVKPTWRLDKGAGLLHIECAGYESYVHVFINSIRHKEAVQLIDGKRSIQLSGPIPQGDLFINVVRLKK